MSTDELKSLHAKSELRPGAGVDLHRVVLHAPIFDDGVADARVRVVIGSCSAGLHKQLRVGDGGGCLDLHEHHLFEVHLQWVSVCINLCSEQLALIELKLEGKRTEAPLLEGVWVFVRESQGQVVSLRIDTREGDLNVMLPRNDFIWVSRCDLVLEDDVIVILLNDGSTCVQRHDGHQVGCVGTFRQVAGRIAEVVQMQVVLVTSDEVGLLHFHCYCCFIACHNGLMVSNISSHTA